jgi:glycosyltransferase involved in cell wall biosynthesis
LNDTQDRQVSGDDKKLALLYSKAHAFIYPSLYEGFGLPPLEAMASGCPVVSSNTSSMPEVIRGSGEYFIPSSIEDMRSAIERVVYSGQRRSELISLGYENINDFSWQHCAEQTLQVYKKVAG